MNNLRETTSRVALSENGLSLPIVLFLVLTIMSASAIFSIVGTQNIREMKITEASTDSFYVAEGAIQDFIAQLGVYSQLWREKVNLVEIPLNYEQFNPLSYASSNGIPNCSGHACQRLMYPIGGGLLKNFGPMGADGDIVNPDATVINQLSTIDPQTPDVVLNNKNAWYQVERLDETSVTANSIGASLSNYEAHSSGYAGVRFRITALAQRPLKGKMGFSSIVAVVELPPA
jgi:hypothetical protein